MGKGKAWSVEECVHLSEAHIEVSEDHSSSGITGTNQTSGDFFSRVIAVFKSKKPFDALDGTHNTRMDKAIVNMWKEKIRGSVQEQCRKFNKFLNKVCSTKPTGVT